MRLIAAVAALSLVSAPAQAQRELHWRDLRVDARLDENGTLRLVETQTIVFTGDWNGGERTFNVRPRQRLRFVSMRRLDANGQAHPMYEGDLSAVDQYDFVDSRTLRWWSRMPSDPPFNATPITYELVYELSNVLVREGDDWLLDHDFAFADRPGLIENVSVNLVDLEPNWQPTVAFEGRWETANLPPGESFVIQVPLRYAGAGDGPEVSSGAEPIERAILAGVALLLLASFGKRLVDHERGTGRLEPLPPPASVDEKWLEKQIFAHLPEVVGAAWDNSTNASEVAAVLARLCAEGRMKSDVRPGGMFKGPVLSLELLADRDRFHGHEQRLIDALFEADETTTDTERIRERYKKSGFDPAGKIQKPLKELVTRLAPGTNPSKPSALPSFLTFVLAIALLITAVVREPADAPVVFITGAVTIVSYFLAVAGAAAWRNRVHEVGSASFFFLIPLGIALAAVMFVVVTGITLASTVALAGLTALLLALANSVLNQARTRENADRIAFRRRLAVARSFFVDELRRDQPHLKDAWFPYLIAFGLGKHMDKWFRAFGGEGAVHAGAAGYSSGSGSSGNSGSGWTGFGGGGGFSGGGSSGSWVAAASSMAAGVSAPSSSGGSSSGGGGGGGSSGGGGGGGW